MANFNFSNDAERDGLILRAQLLKPKHEGVRVDERGYVLDHPNGTTEVLVSFRDLDKLLNLVTDVKEDTPTVTEPAPIEVAVEVKSELVIEEKVEETKTETRKERKARATKAAE